MNLEHVLVEVCQQEEKVGGIMASALIHRAQAIFANEGLPAPPEDEIKEAIFDLMASEALILTPQRKLMAKAKQPRALAPKKELRNASGLWPIGPGDYLYNQAGERVARVVNLVRVSKDFDMTLELLFEQVVTYEFLGPGEVVTASKNPGPLAPSGIPDRDRYRGKYDKDIHGYNTGNKQTIK